MKVKYRGYHRVEDKLLPVEMMDFRNDVISLNEGDNSLSDTFEMVELMQCTGIKDINGKEIYEGDIVKYTDGDYIKRIGKIEIECYGFMLSEIVDKNSRDWCPQIDFLGNIDDMEEMTFEVIGNIFEDKELLMA